jgi:hypothetical protein
LCPLITTKIERIPPFEKGGKYHFHIWGDRI